MHGKPIECYNKSSGEVCNAGCSHSSCLWYQVGCMVGCLSSAGSGDAGGKIYIVFTIFLFKFPDINLGVR